MSLCSVADLEKKFGGHEGPVAGWHNFFAPKLSTCTTQIQAYIDNSAHMISYDTTMGGTGGFILPKYFVWGGYTVLDKNRDHLNSAFT